MIINLTLVSKDYNVLATPTLMGFQSDDMVDPQVNVETSLGGSSSFVIDGIFYTVSETLAIISGLSAAPIAPSYTETERDALTAVEGQVIVNSTDKKLNVYLDDAWEEITSA